MNMMGKLKVDIFPSSKSDISVFLIAMFISVLFIYLFSFAVYAILLLSLIIHEIGHYVANKIYGKNIAEVHFSIYKPSYVSSISKRNEIESMIISIAGPVFGILTVLLIPLLYGTFNVSVDTFFTARIIIFVQLFNLIPLNNYDGAYVYSSILNRNKSKLQSAVKFILVYIMVIAYALILYGLLHFI